MCDNEKCSCHCEDVRYQELSGKPEIENIQEEIFKFWEMATYEQAIYFIFVEILLNYLYLY